MNISSDCAVSLKYSLKNGDGELIDESNADDPLHYLHGHDNLLPAVEEQLQDKKVGDKLAFSLPPEKGYGVRHEEGVHELQRSEFPADAPLQPGLQLELQTDDGVIQAFVTDVQDSIVTIDLNHPLAGETLNFDIEVLAVRTASSEEIDHGHIHGPGCHH